MPEPWMDWIKPILDEHFLEQDRKASNQEELKELTERQQGRLLHLEVFVE